MSDDIKNDGIYREISNPLGQSSLGIDACHGDPKFYLTSEIFMQIWMNTFRSPSRENFENGEKATRMYIQKRYEDPHAHYSLGIVCNMLRKHEAAEFHFGESIAYGGDDWLFATGAYNGRANALFMQEKNILRALYYNQKAIDLTPEAAFPWETRGIYYAHLAGNETAAISCFDNAIARNSGIINLYHMRAQCYLRTSNNRKAIEDIVSMTNLIGLKKDSKASKYFLGCIDTLYSEMEKKANGIFGLPFEEYKKILKSQPYLDYDQILDM